ncbi:MAG TPA: hypothetical protein VI488_05635 [Candidatus Angelobacter sp.]
MNPHTPPALPLRRQFLRKLLCAVLPLALFSLVATAQAAAQNNGHGNNRAAAVLQIQAQVVPVTYPPPARTSERPPGGVVYSLPSSELAMTVVEEIHVLTGSDAIAWLRGQPGQVVILKTLTVVPQ